MNETIESPPNANTKRYHVGLRAFHEDSNLPCPVDMITLAGVTFHRHTEKVTGWGPDTRRHRVPGGYANLTEADLQRVRNVLEKKRCQFLAHDPKTREVKVYVDETVDPPRSYVRARIMTLGVRGYIAKDSDQRLDGWIYVVEQEAPTVYESQDPIGSVNVLSRKDEKKQPASKR